VFTQLAQHVVKKGNPRSNVYSALTVQIERNIDKGFLCGPRPCCHASHTEGSNQKLPETTTAQTMVINEKFLRYWPPTVAMMQYRLH
jgi:hypothetical protein